MQTRRKRPMGWRWDWRLWCSPILLSIKTRLEVRLEKLVNAWWMRVLSGVSPNQSPRSESWDRKSDRPG
jgi:hypothetical protein